MSTEHEIERAKAAAVGMTLLRFAEMTDGLAMLGARTEYAGVAGISITDAGREIDSLVNQATTKLLAEALGQPEHNADRIQETLDAAVAHIRKVRATPTPETLSLDELDGLTRESARLTGLYAKAAGIAFATAIARVFNEVDEVDGLPQ